MCRFLSGSPMYYCQTCHFLPGDYHLHYNGPRHRKALSRLVNPSPASELALRRVTMDAWGNHVARLVLPPLPSRFYH
jgi:hypothetical protein